MFEQIPAPDHVIAVHLSDTMSGEDIKEYKAIFDDKLQKHDRLTLLVDFTGLSDMTANALVEGTKADMELLGHIGKFSKCAFVSEKQWPEAIVRFIDPLFPPFEMKVFKPEHRDEAVTWAAEFPDAPTNESHAFRFIPTTKDDVFAFEINGMLTAEEMPGIVEQFESYLERHSKVRLLNRMKHFGGFDPAVFMQGGLFSMKMAALQKVERYAVVGAPGWMTRAVSAMNPVLADMDIQTFPADREADAWAWLGAEPAE